MAESAIQAESSRWRPGSAWKRLAAASALALVVVVAGYFIAHYLQKHPYPDVVWVEEAAPKRTLLSGVMDRLGQWFTIFERKYSLTYSLWGATADGSKRWRIATIGNSRCADPASPTCRFDNIVIIGRDSHLGFSRVRAPWRAYSVFTGKRVRFARLSKLPNGLYDVICGITNGRQPIVALGDIANSIGIYVWDAREYCFNLVIERRRSDKRVISDLTMVSAFNNTAILSWQINNISPKRLPECEVEILNLATGESRILDFGKPDEELFSVPPHLVDLKKPGLYARTDIKGVSLIRPALGEKPAIFALRLDLTFTDTSADVFGYGVYGAVRFFEMGADGEGGRSISLPPELGERVFQVTAAAFDATTSTSYFAVNYAKPDETTLETPYSCAVIKVPSEGAWHRIYNEPIFFQSSEHSIDSLTIASDSSVWFTEGWYDGDWTRWNLKRWDPSTGIVSDVNADWLASPRVLVAPR